MKRSRHTAGIVLVGTLVGAVLLVADRSQPTGQSPLPFDPSRTQVVLLGSGTPILDGNKAEASVAIVTDGTAYVVDLGSGAVERATQAAERGIQALRLPTHVFITHLHSDHVLDYPELLWTLWWRRPTPIVAYGPRGLRALTESLLTTFAEDIRIREDGAQPVETRGYQAEVHEIDGTLRYEDDLVRVTGFPVCHEEIDAYGYRFETADRTVVVSGDTTFCERVIEASRGADILLHEVFSERGLVQRTDEWQRYHRAAHTSPAQVAEVATRAAPGLLVLYHQLYFGTSDDELIGEVRAAGYAGPLVSGRDLDVF